MDSSQEKRTAASSAAVKSEGDKLSYEELAALYDESMRNLDRGRDRHRPGRSAITVQLGHRRRRLQVRGADPDRRVHRPRRQGRRQGRRRGRRPAREDRGPRGARPALLAPRPSACARWTEVERGLQGRQDHQGPRHRPHQGRPDGRRRPARLPARARWSTSSRSRTSSRCAARSWSSRSSASTAGATTSCCRARPCSRRSCEKKKAETLKRLEEGARLKGVVKNITDYGVFIDLGGIDGLLHITDISWGRVNHPSEHFSVGDEVEVVVLKFDPETERVSLGYKQKQRGSLDAGRQEVPDRLARARQGGLARRLRRLRRDRGGRRGPDPRQRDVVDQEGGQPGQGPGGRRTRSRRSSPSSTWTSGASACRCARPSATRGRSCRTPIPVGTVIEGKVRNLTEFGAFVEITEGIDGLIHVSDMSWTKRVKHPSEVLKKGDMVRARITNIDVENQRVSLSIKEFLPNEWEDFVDSHRVGDMLDGPGGQRHRLRPLHRHLQRPRGSGPRQRDRRAAGGKLEDHFEVGDWVRARILRIEEDEKKVGLSMRGVTQPIARRRGRRAQVGQEQRARRGERGRGDAARPPRRGARRRRAGREGRRGAARRRRRRADELRRPPSRTTSEDGES